MTRKLRRNYCLSVVVPFVAILIAFIALSGPAQVTGASQPSVQQALVPTQLAPAAKAQQVGFAKAVTYSAGGFGGASIAIVDLNGDGTQDLVVANNCQNESNCNGRVSVLVGNGDGTFQAPVNYDSGGDYAMSVAIGDVNGDGKLDLVVANCGSSGTGCATDNGGVVSVLLGNGDGTFQAPVSYNSGGNAPSSIAVGDVNGDGKLDVVVANNCVESCDHGVVGVLLGNGDGTFQSPILYNSGEPNAYSVAIGDLNGDGKLDVIVANWGGWAQASTVGVLLGNGDGTFQPLVSYGTGGYEAISVAIGDLNGDGKLDLVVANACYQIYLTGRMHQGQCKGNGSVGVLLGNGDGTFQAPISYNSGAVRTWWVSIGDVNGDGVPDLVAISPFCCSDKTKPAVRVFVGTGDGTFQPSRSYSSGDYEAAAAAIGDVNGDGRADIVVANLSSVGVLLNDLSVKTTTALASSPNPSLVNQSVTFTATVTSTRPIPDGQIVTFTIGRVKIGTGSTTNGVASLTTSFSQAKTYTINATYAGGGFLGHSSGTVKQLVEQ
ncbi:MAG: FG-GAP-like repeat-containing protein [Terriglobales bacterium]|jgi:uncharacterized protein (DUF2141 family)